MEGDIKFCKWANFRIYCKNDCNKCFRVAKKRITERFDIDGKLIDKVTEDL